MAAEVPVPEWLPPGWKVEVKVRKTGLKDKYYSRLLDGRKFRSKNEVLQYIESTKSETSIPQKVIPAPHATGVIVEKNKSIDDLPEGWIVEFKTRNGGAHAGRQDKYFIDPSTGYKFNSLTKVWNYLKTNEKGSGRSSTKHFLEKPARVTKGRKLPHLRARRSLLGGQTSNSNASVMVNEFTSNNNPDSDLTGPDNSVCHNEDTSKLLVEHGDTTHVGCRNIKSNKDSETQETESSITKSLESPFKEGDPNQPMNKNLGISAEDEVNKNANDNKVELNHLADGGASAVEWKRTKQLAGRSNNKRKRDYPPDESKVRKAIPLPPRRSSRLATLKDKLNSDLDNSELQVKVAGEQSESYPATRQSLGGLNQEALPEEGITAEMNSQSKQQQVSEDAKDGANCPLQPPFGDLWPDPCLEFAFKTLTDAIPVECIPPNGWLVPSASPMKFQVSGGDQDVK